MLTSCCFITKKIGIRSTLLVVAGLAGISSAQAQTFVPVDPTTTYLHTNQDTGGNSQAILLSSLTFNGHFLRPGDVINLAETGDFAFNQTPLQFGKEMTGIFSSSNTLTEASFLHRVPDAVRAGDDVVTDPTLHGNEATDIPEDFGVAPGAGTTLTIPAGAQYLFLSAADDYFGDNTNPHNDFGVTINFSADAVPEASTTVSLGLLLALGLGGIVLTAHRRSCQPQTFRPIVPSIA